MASLTIPNIFTAGTPALASEVNANFTAVVNWSTGLDQDNMATFTGDLAFTIANGNAIVIQNNGNDESIKITQGALLGAGKASILITDNQTQTASGAAELKMVLAAGATIPAIHVTHGGVDTFKLTKNTVKLPVKTTAQRNAISSPEEGSLLYNSTEKNIAIYNGTSWVPPVKVDNSTLEYNANEAARIKDSGVTTAKIADLNVTKQKLQLLGEQQEVDTARSTGSITFVSTNYQLTITTIGRPVLICLTGEYFGGGNTSSGSVHEVQLQLKRDSTVLNVWSAKIGIGSGGNPEFRMPLSAIWFDKPAAGTYVYEFFYRQSSGGDLARLGAAQFTVVEL